MKRLLYVLLIAAGSAHAQTGAYVSLPPAATPKASTLVGDVARAYASGNAQAQAQASAEQLVDPGREPSVVEVSPGVFHFDVGVPASTRAKPVAPAPNNGAPVSPAQASAAASAPSGMDVRSIAPPEWRIGIYGGAETSSETSEQAPVALNSPAMKSDAGPVSATAAVEAPVAVKTAPSGSAFSAAARADVVPAKKSASGSASVRAVPKLSDWPKVR